jgi:hypothetical protein
VQGLGSGALGRGVSGRRHVNWPWRKVEPDSDKRTCYPMASHEPALREVIVSRQKGTIQAGHPGYEGVSCSLARPGDLAPIRGRYFRSLQG